jgi:hypothetical protein
MMLWRFISFLILAILPVTEVVKCSALTQRKDPAYYLWLVRSQTITEELIKDAADLESLQQALLLAKLAQRWWPDNPEKAKPWMARAIETVEDVPNKESAENRRRRLATARQLLLIATPLDRKFSSHLVEILSEDLKHVGAAEQSANADGLVDAAISLVENDPVRAAELGTLSLRLAHSNNLAYLILTLRRKNPKLADELLSQALVLARQTLDANLLMPLTRATFPAEMQLGTEAPLPVDQRRTELLQIDIAYLQANPITVENRNSVCGPVISVFLPLMFEFERRLPQQVPAVRQAVNQCQSLSPLAHQLIDDALRTQPLITIDDLLKAAEDSQDLKVRTVYQYRAAALAKEKKQYDKALAILDGISNEGRQFMGTSWRAYRWDWATLSAIDHYTRGDLNGMRLTIEAVPTDLQVFVKLALLDRLPAKRNRDNDPTIEFLNDARKELPRSNDSDERFAGYVMLLKLTVQYQPTDASGVLKEAIATLNLSEQEKLNVQNDEIRNLDGSGLWKNLSDSLIEMDEYAVKEAVATISSTETRAELRLELLQACLNRMRRNVERIAR